MQFLTAAIALSSTLLPLSLAAPSRALYPRNATQEYYLRTTVTAGDASKDNLYVQAYHTGAGFNDAVLVPREESQPNYNARGFLNGTLFQFSLGNSFPWFLDMVSNANYAAWEPVQINAASAPSSGFYVNATEGPGLLWNSGYEYGWPANETSFAGWLVCDWVHGLPQLFFRVKGYEMDRYPNSCSEVALVLEAEC